VSKLVKFRHRSHRRRRTTAASRKKGRHFEKSLRIQLVDFLRGVALLGMTVVHGAWDLEFFGFLASGTSDMVFWALFASLVASSFLGLSGISLHLAHVRGIRWRSWGRRVVIVALAAGCVTAVTAVVTPDEYIRFGILHMIAVGSILGLGVLHLPGWGILTCAAAVGVISYSIPGGLLDGAAGYVLGFGAAPPVTSDYRPIFPWLASVLFGIGGARLLQDLGWWTVLGRIAFAGRAGRILCWLGRHSLAYYLIHQPVLFGILWAALKISG